jgi:hypothetical protein
MTKEEKIKGYKKKYYLKNRKRILEQSKEYRKEYCKEYAKKNKDKIKEYRKEYYKKNKSKICKQTKKYAKTHPRKKRPLTARRKESHKIYMRKYVMTDKRKKYISQYYQSEKFKETNRNNSSKRRAGCKKTDITAKFLIELKSNTTYCEICGKKLKDNIHLDHIIPINIGGLHIKSNVRYVHAKCNLQRPKNGSDIIQFKLLL